MQCGVRRQKWFLLLYYIICAGEKLILRTRIKRERIFPPFRLLLCVADADIIGSCFALEPHLLRCVDYLPISVRRKIVLVRNTARRLTLFARKCVCAHLEVTTACTSQLVNRDNSTIGFFLSFIFVCVCTSCAPLEPHRCRARFKRVKMCAQKG